MATPRCRRVLVVANKNWEVAPLMDVLLEPRACPPLFPWPTMLPPVQAWQAGSRPPKTPEDIKKPHPRAVFRFEIQGGPSGAATVEVEVWCIQDWMAPPPTSSSSSFEKMRILPSFFKWSAREDEPARPADFVVAFGTAGFPTAISSYNGCVVVGANTFIFNAHAECPNPDSPWDDSGVKRPIPATLKKDFFSPSAGVFDDSLHAQIQARMISPPNYPAEREMLIAAYNYTAVAAVNVTDYDEYAWADPKALAEFGKADQLNPAGSIETTHALIRQQSDAPFLFVSAITDREGGASAFNMEVASRNYGQNFVAAHNGGVAVAWLLPKIAAYVAAQP